jgi:type IV fimbrial biogenesis protein FimT
MKLLSPATTSARGHAIGFTLIELLVTLTVAGILFGIGVPAYRTFVQNDRDAGQVNSLVLSLNYARSEAVKRASANGVTFCPSVDGVNCDLAPGPWTEGWIVTFLDPVNGNQVLQAVPALQGAGTPGGNTVNTVTGPATGITFSSSGLASAALTLRVCDTRGAAFARQVEVNITGRVAASQQPGKSVAGAALACP